MSKPVTVTLLRDHTHASQQHKAGSKLQVSALTRDWLAAHNLIRTEAAPQKEAKDGNK